MAGSGSACKRPAEAGGAAEGLGVARKRSRTERGGRHKAKEKSSRLSAALFGEDCEVSHDQVYELLKYAALGKCHNATQPSWCHIYHQSHLAGVVVIVLHEMSQLHFYKFYLQFKHLRKVFQHRFTLPPSSASFLANLYGEGANVKPQNNAQEVIVIQRACTKPARDYHENFTEIVRSVTKNLEFQS